MMHKLRFLLYPFSFLYGSLLSLRNLLYDFGLFPSRSFATPVISVGNLSMGGTGKTPMTEYLIRLFSPDHQVATLSRGYGRSSSGFVYVEQNSTSDQVGDEPRQFKHKFPEITVAVQSNRIQGINKLLAENSRLGVILLDDAFQHRAVKPALSILLTEYSKPYYTDRVVPGGSLREFKSGAKRADILIVTKCPETLSPIEKRTLSRNINPKPYQNLFFTSITYAEPCPLGQQVQKEQLVQQRQPAQIDSRSHILLLTGIANPQPLLDHIRKKTASIVHLRYPDHHPYSIVELEALRKQFLQTSADNTCILTTEKDAMRIDKSGLLEVLQDLPVYYIPIRTNFLFDEGEAFNKILTHHVKTHPKLS